MVPVERGEWKVRTVEDFPDQNYSDVESTTNPLFWADLMRIASDIVFDIFSW